ncbi:putative disease resistance RPP13-like protein 1 [Vitis vinifera]|uniref:Putative disease resistance RPP13-like protein 1 n=1 Tax=Vitis vinifera TaxID=29760 RepID=A0A438CLZ9_VITVI|nr:putative disease resistance RPP13-like protein 1 [Vitis vinifera]
MAGALVGGAFLSASLQVLFDRLASREVVRFIRGHKLSDALLKKLERKLLVVHAVLNDAEVKQFTNPYVKKWLVLLKEAVYDAEDILDEIATEALRHKVEGCGVPNQHKSESRVEEIIDRLEDMARDRDVLGLKEGVGEKLAQRWPSTSLVDESLVYGRDQIKEKMVQLLLSNNARSTDAMGVISIVGMGGTGKTTLAQLLYNDQRVKKHFDLKAWVCVSEEFDPIRVTKTILEAINSSTSNTTDLNLLQVQLKERINMKKSLLVLDDVWNEDSCDWDALRTPLIVGAKGSKIIVTTRSTKVASAMRAVHTHCLGGLSFEDGWSLFKKLAFENGDSSGHPQLEAIGEKIVHKCQGLPLAIKAMGSLLHSKVEAREWDDVLNSELWDLPTDAVLPALRSNMKDKKYLDELKFEWDNENTDTWRIPSLQKLCINECPKLIGKLPKQLRSLKKLEIIDCELLLGSLRAPQIREWKMSYHGKFRLKRTACGFTNLQTSEIEISHISQWEELPPRIQILTIREYLAQCWFAHYIEVTPYLCNSFSLSFSLSIFPRLNSLNISDFEGFEFLSISVSDRDPTSLNYLTIEDCPDLIYIELPALESARYEISRCRKLKLLAHTHSSLQELRLIDCPELLFQRDGLPSDLRDLEISSCNQLTSQVDWGLQRLASLTIFTINDGCRDMESFPNESLLPSTLTSLYISNLPNLKSLDSNGLRHLTSLTTLYISKCPKFQSFGEEGLQHLTSLENLQMYSLPMLESLREVGLQHLTSLKALSISRYHNLQYLTNERLPNSLSFLEIQSCPLLRHRQKQTHTSETIPLEIYNMPCVNISCPVVGDLRVQNSPFDFRYFLLCYKPENKEVKRCGGRLTIGKHGGISGSLWLYEAEMCDILYPPESNRWSEEDAALLVPESLTGIEQGDGNQHFTRDGVYCASACIKGEISNISASPLIIPHESPSLTGADSFCKGA